MSYTLIEKLLSNASGKPVAQGDFVDVPVDLAVLIDVQFAHDRLMDVKKVHDPDKIAIIMDHAVPAPRVHDAISGQRARTFAERHEIDKIVDIGRHGIVHQVIAESGFTRPGSVLACTDSHTCAAGALNVVARGLGPAELLQIACTGKTWFEVPPTILYKFTGSLRQGINGKDIFLWIANKYGDATGYAWEFGGALRQLPVPMRRTISTQSAEVGAEFAIFPGDELLEEYLRVNSVTGEFPMYTADDGAEYAFVREVPLDEIEPMVGLPGTVIENAVGASELEDVRIDQAFIGSCANGQLEDFAVAAEILEGRSVAPGVRLIVTPASQKVYLEALEAGYIEKIMTAGGVVTNSTCGACFGYHMGVLAPGEVCITSSTRNFKGRMGSAQAEIYMASPATVAASAISGHIVDPEVLHERA